MLNCKNDNGLCISLIASLRVPALNSVAINIVSETLHFKKYVTV